MKICYNPTGEYFNLQPDTTEEYYTLKLINDTQCKITTENVLLELIKRMFKYTVDGKEVTADEFIKYYELVLGIDSKRSK